MHFSESGPAGSSGPWHGTTILTVRKAGLVAIGYYAWLDSQKPGG